MNIKESIIYYITLYYGSEKRIIENVVADHLYEFLNVSRAKSAVKSNIDWLIENMYISVVDYTEMDSYQKNYYESDGYCRIFKIIKRYNESEYLKEKYGS